MFPRIGLFALVAGAIPHGATPTFAQAPITLGWVENALVGENRAPFRAKLDTGAKSSSINTEKIETFRRNGRDWVTFTVVNREGHRINMTKRVHRWVRIRRANAKKVERPVVLLHICVGTYSEMAQVNLTSRKGMLYPLLIGRRFLGGKILVDSSRSFTREPRCSK